MKTSFDTIRKVLIGLVLILLAIDGKAQKSPEKAIQKLGANPIYIIDNVKVGKDELSKQDAEEVTYVQVLYNKDAIKQFGSEAKDGVVIVETKAFARKKYISYLRKKSPSFDSLYVKIGDDKNFVYILNDKIQTGNYEGNLGIIDDAIFIDLEIINQANLIEKYQVTDKLYGILIRSKKPKDLYNKNDKF